MTLERGRRISLRLVLLGGSWLVPGLALALVPAPDARIVVDSLLRSIEAPPSPARIDEVAGGSDHAATLLRDMADSTESRPHTRLQAISTLASYPGTPTEARLRLIVERGQTVRAGAPTLFARAAMLSLAPLARGRAVPEIAPLLDHAVPDVRADAARALGMTGSESALPPLRTRLQIEESPMVTSEIVDSIRILTP